MHLFVFTRSPMFLSIFLSLAKEILFDHTARHYLKKREKTPASIRCLTSTLFTNLVSNTICSFTLMLANRHFVYSKTNRLMAKSRLTVHKFSKISPNCPTFRSANIVTIDTTLCTTKYTIIYAELAQL